MAIILFTRRSLAAGEAAAAVTVAPPSSMVEQGFPGEQREVLSDGSGAVVCSWRTQKPGQRFICPQ